MGNPEISLVQIIDSIYSYIGITNPGPKNSLGVNRAVIIGKDYSVAIDSGISSKEAKRFIRDIRKVTRKPIKFLINTHSHPDHVFGNSEFSKINTAIISHENCKNKMYELEIASEIVKLKDIGLTENDMEGTILSYPDLTFNSKMELDLGNFKVEIHHFGRAHTSGDTLIYIPEKRLLFTGDILEKDYYPYIGDPEADIYGWNKVLEKILNLDVEMIIPGHGPISRKDDVVDMNDYLIKFDKNAKKLSLEYNDIKKIVDKLEDILPKKSEMSVTIGASVAMKYLNRNS